MKRSFFATAALVAVFALCASTVTAQQTFINDGFGAGAGASAPGWSVLALNGTNPVDPVTGDDGSWRWDDLGLDFGLVAAPMVAPFASANSDHAGIFAYVTSLQSGQHDVSGAGQVLLSYDYHYRPLGDTSTVEAFDGSAWNVVGSPTGNWATGTEVSTDQFDITAALGGATNGRVRFVYSANFDWWWGVDNVNMFEPAPVDVGAINLLAPTINLTSCFHSLTATETVSVEWQNFGSAPVNPGTLVNVNVDFDMVSILTEIDSPAAPIAPGATNIYTTLGVVDMSATGAHVLDVTCTIAGDADTSNDTLSTAYTSPAQATQTYGWSENFDALPSNNSGFAMTVFDVPAGWVNAQDDGASVAGNTSPDWGPNNGTTGSNQGPTGDNTTGAGIYMYIEDSQSQAGDIELRTPCLDLSGAAGTPTFQFAHHSKQVAGATTDNILDVDVINESTGGTVTMSVGTFPGNGVVTWVNHSIDLSAFAPDIVRCQFRTNNNNANFTDDVAIDDVRLFDAVTPIGQAPQAGNAVFDINNSINSLGMTVPSGSPGPYTTSIPGAGTMDMDWSGQNNGIVICLFGPAADAIASFPGVGQLDIGTLPLNGAGIPGTLFVFGDGSQPFPFGPLFNNFFFTGPAGTGGVELQLPGFLPGPLTRFQCVMNPPGLFFISNAVDVNIL